MNVARSRKLRRLSVFLQAGTALPLLFGTTAQAQPITEYSAGDIVIDEDSASGTPVAVDVYTTGGSASVKVQTITATAPDDARADVVYIGVEGPGSITADFGSIVASGGNLRGALFETDSGDIDATVGTVTIEGTATAGVHAISTSGDVTVTATEVRANGTGSDPNFEVYPEAVLAYSGQGSATAIVGNAETYGLYGSAVIAYAGTDAVVVVDTATAHSDGAVAVLANGGTSASVTAGSVTMTGTGTAVEGFSNGEVVIDVDSVTSAGLGIYAETPDTATVTAGDVTGARGIYINGFTTADVTVNVTDFVEVTSAYAVLAVGDTVDVNAAVGSTIYASGPGIIADAQTAASISAHNIQSGGQSIRASTVSGPIDVTVTGDLESANANVISLIGDGITIAIEEGSTLTAHGGGGALAMSGRNGDVSITNGGEIYALGNTAGGIGVTAGGDITIDSNVVVVETDAEPVSNFVSAGINADSLGGNVSITANRVIVDAPSRNGISATAIGDGAISITADTVSNAGNDRVALRAETEQGDIAIVGNTVTTTGIAGLGAYGHSIDGDVSITIGNVTTTGDGMVNGHVAEGAFALSDNGIATVTVGTADITSYAASGAVAIGGAGASVVAGTVTIAGQFAAATLAQSDFGDASADVGTVYLTGGSQSGANVLGYGGNATLNIGTVIGSGTNGNGALAVALNDVSVTSGSIDVEDYGIYGLSQNGGAVDIATTGDTLADSRWALRGAGADVSITTGSDTLTQGGTRGIWIAASDSATVLNQGTASATGDLGSAILVTAPGAISITSDTVLVSGAGAFPGLREGEDMRIEQGGIIVEGGAGPISVTSGTVDVDGEHRYGISVRGDGPITIDAGTTMLESADAVAIVARGGAGDVSITAGTTVTTGASGVGIFGNTTSGNITIIADETRADNTGIGSYETGDAIVAISDSGNIAIESNTAVSAGESGSAIYAYSGTGDVSVVSDYAASTGDAGFVIAAVSGSGNVTIDAATVEAATPVTYVVAAYAYDGTADVTLGDVTGGAASRATVQVYAAGEASLDITGSVVSDSTSAAVFVTSLDGRAFATINNLTAAGSRGVRVSGGIAAYLDVHGNVTTTEAGVEAIASGGIAANVLISGNVTSGANGASSTGASAMSGSALVTILEGGSVSAYTFGVVANAEAAGATASVFNSGTITQTGSGGYGVALDGDYALLSNDGVIEAKSGYAMVSFATSTRVELFENSRINGTLFAQNLGLDTITLAFADTASANLGQVAASRYFENLLIQSGYWVANTGNSSYDRIDIYGGATLEVQQVGGFASVIAPTIQMDGDLVLNFDTDTEAGDFTGLQLDGAGGLYLTGEAIVLFDDTTGLDYTGGTFVQNGTLIVTDVLASNVETSGDGTFQLGDGGTSGWIFGDVVNNGSFVFARSDDLTLGNFSGNGTLDKYGDGQLLFAGEYAFDGLTTIYGGSIALTGTLAEDTELSISGGVFDLSQVQGGAQTIASLSGTGGTLILGETALTVIQTGTTVYSGDITGSGEFIIDGTGDLKLEGDISFTGDAIVNGGTLSVNGSMTGADFFINEGGTLGGNGEVGDVYVDGGTLGAGNSIGILDVVGDLTLTAGSTFEIEVNAAGASDLVNVSGTATLNGATASVLAEDGEYAAYTEYTVLTAGSVSGTFGEATTNFAFLTPGFEYSDTDVTLILRRNDIAFADLGATANQSAIGDLIENAGLATPLYDEVLMLVEGDVAGAFETLSGEAYPAYASAVVENVDLLRRQMRPEAVGDGAFGWAVGLTGGTSGSADGYRSARIGNDGIAGGLGYKAGPLRASVGVGRIWQDSKGLGIDGESTVVGADAEFGSILGFSANAGVQFGNTDAKSSRMTSIGSINDELTASFDSKFTQVYGEVSYSLGTDLLSFGPFAGLSVIDLNFDDIEETGGPTALTVTDLDRKVTFGRFGAKAQGSVSSLVSLEASAAWRKAWGDREGTASVRFDGNSQSAAISGVSIAKNALELDAHVTVGMGPAKVTLGYDGSISKAFDSHGAKIGVAVSF